MEVLSNLNLSYPLVFIEGILSFLSPCVLPILPIYMGYLAGQADVIDETGRYHFDQKKVMGNTLFFILGISAAFFLLAMTFTALGSYLSAHRQLLTRSAGIFIVLMGLIQIGFLEVKWFQKERKLPFKVKVGSMNPLTALMMGFVFSFAWTPCVGPALSSVLLMASSAKSSLGGYLLVGLYALGFALPFMLLGLFTTQILTWLDQRMHWLKYAIKLGGGILIVMGVMLYTGFGNSFSSYLNETQTPINNQSTVGSAKPEASSEKEIYPAMDFELKDQYGEVHRLSDYKGKVVFLNFWATWCPPCRNEMPHIQALYEAYGKNQGDVVFLSVAGPNQGQEQDSAGITQFLKDEGFTWPSVMDDTGEVFAMYSVSALPTTFMIDKSGNIYGYVSGQLTEDIMKKIIEETLTQ